MPFPQQHPWVDFSITKCCFLTSVLHRADYLTAFCYFLPAASLFRLSHSAAAHIADQGLAYILLLFLQLLSLNDLRLDFHRVSCLLFSSPHPYPAASHLIPQHDILSHSISLFQPHCDRNCQFVMFTHTLDKQRKANRHFPGCWLRPSNELRGENDSLLTGSLGNRWYRRQVLLYLLTQ